MIFHTIITIGWRSSALDIPCHWWNYHDSHWNVNSTFSPELLELHDNWWDKWSSSAVLQVLESPRRTISARWNSVTSPHYSEASHYVKWKNFSWIRPSIGKTSCKQPVTTLLPSLGDRRLRNQSEPTRICKTCLTLPRYLSCWIEFSSLFLEKALFLSCIYEF